MNDLSHLADLHVTEQHHQYTHDATYGLYQILISPRTNTGWYQHEFRPIRGVLHFRKGVLQSIEGPATLPGEVKLGLQKAGFVVPD